MVFEITTLSPTLLCHETVLKDHTRSWVLVSMGLMKSFRKLEKCKLKLPPTYKIHPVFHVFQLKRAIGNQVVSPTIPEQLTTELELVAELEELLEVRHRGEENAVSEVLIKWKGHVTI